MQIALAIKNQFRQSASMCLCHLADDILRGRCISDVQTFRRDTGRLFHLSRIFNGDVHDSDSEIDCRETGLRDVSSAGEGMTGIEISVAAFVVSKTRPA
ncbi:hypothetical protein Mal52_20230 [Symmachiella dynata]|uniref:Uncharacterized protein n=1 Tax=Symmachiella dynata TaxID=2527995 RepID=A0A517ZM63_9PLAN|nr:hypothetical protein Mal52_20230 [Symmachiella dynata]